MTRTARSLLISAAVVVIGVLISLAAGADGPRFAGIPALTWVVLGAFVIQWVAFVPSLLLRTDRHFDLTGSLTYLTLTALILALTPERDARTWLVAVLVTVWAVRLGSFLFARVSRSGGDSRFTEILAAPPRLFTVWSIQGLWVSLTAMAAWTAMTSPHRAEVGWWTVAAALLWVAGFVLEVTADVQKSRFRADPAHAGEFITTGLWAWSRHPNYLGEILMWTAVLLIAAPVLAGWSWIVVLSPVFVVLLLTRVSGVPQLEKAGEKRWGDRQDYRDYVARTPVLLPRPPRRS